MGFFNKNVQKLFTLQYKKIDFFSKNPIEMQEQVLMDLLEKARATEWGNQFHYKNISNSKEFSRNVPLND